MQLGGLYVKPRRNSRKAKHTKAYRTIEALLSIWGLLVRAKQRILTVRYFYTLNIDLWRILSKYTYNIGTIYKTY